MCTDARSRCVELGDGATAVVYPALTKQSGDAPLLLWEPGGPGLAPLTPGEARTVLPDWAGSYDVALIVERWVVKPPSQACLSVLTAQIFAAGEDDLSVCEPAALQYAPRQYGQLARALDEREGPLVGVYATSFGSTRVESERAGVGHDLWAVVDSPAPVPGTDAATLFEARARAVESKVVSVPACHGDECRDRRAALSDFLRAPQVADGPTASDRAYALLALSHDPKESRAWLTRLWASRGAASADDLDAVVDASLTYTQRTSVDDARPELAGYVFGMCSAYRGWESPETSDPLVEALGKLHRPCREASAPSAQPAPTSSDGSPSPAVGPTLLLFNEDDLVTPVSMQTRWTSRLGGATVLTYAELGHGSAPRRLQADTSRWISRQSTGAR